MATPNDDSQKRSRAEVLRLLFDGLESEPAGSYDDAFRQRLRERAHGTTG